MSNQTPPDKPDEDDNSQQQGEGDRQAARRYNEDAEEFVKSADPEKLTEAARDMSKEELAEAERAEREAEKKSRAEDPAVTRNPESGSQ